jgi:hypothetical protein
VTWWRSEAGHPGSLRGTICGVPNADCLGGVLAEGLRALSSQMVALAVGGVVVGAMTAGLGLVAPMVVVGIGAAAGGGATVYGVSGVAILSSMVLYTKLVILHPRARHIEIVRGQRWVGSERARRQVSTQGVKTKQVSLVLGSESKDSAEEWRAAIEARIRLVNPNASTC